jgi:hypothetical protein
MLSTPCRITNPFHVKIPKFQIPDPEPDVFEQKKPDRQKRPGSKKQIYCYKHITKAAYRGNPAKAGTLISHRATSEQKTSNDNDPA